MSSSRRTLLKLLASTGAAAGVLPALGAADDRPTVADGFDADGGRQEALVVVESRSQLAQLERLSLDLYTFDVLPVVYGRLTPEEIDAVADLSGVRRVVPNHDVEFHNDDAREVTGVAAVREAYGYTGEDIHAVVIDSGLDGSHPDFQGRIRHNYQFSDPLSPSPTWVDAGPANTDDVGHGTHVAGSVAGDGARSDGQYAGMAPDAELTVYSISSGILQAVAAYDHVVANHPDGSVASNSYGLATGDDFDPNHPLNVATWAAFRSGLLPVFSAGNNGDGTNTLNDYAKAPYVVNASAIDDQGSVPSFSSRGREPGQGVVDGANYDRATALSNLRTLLDPSGPAVVDAADYSDSGVVPPTSSPAGGVRHGAQDLTVADVDGADGHVVDLTLTWSPSTGEETAEAAEIELQLEDGDGNTVARTSRKAVNSVDVREDTERRLVAAVEPGDYVLWINPRRGGAEWQIEGTVKAVETDRVPTGLYRPTVAAPGVLVNSTQSPYQPLQTGPTVTGGDPNTQIEQSDEPFYSHLSGTSMSGPVVTGICALVQAAHRDVHGELPDPLTVIQYLEETADLDAAQGQTVVNAGRGVVDAKGAVEAARDVDEPVTIEPIADRSVEAGETVRFDVVARPGDGVTLSADGVPAGATFDDFGDGHGTFIWETEPGDNAHSPYVVTITATDGDTTDSEAVEITVEPPRGNPNA
jgi:serine protease AprX